MAPSENLNHILHVLEIALIALSCMYQRCWCCAEEERLHHLSRVPKLISNREGHQTSSSHAEATPTVLTASRNGASHLLLVGRLLACFFQIGEKIQGEKSASAAITLKTEPGSVV